MKKWCSSGHLLWLSTSICIFGLTTPTTVFSASFSYNYLWATGSNAGRSAGVCSFIIPDNRPFQNSRTLIVDNSLPDGSVIFSWDYNNFFPEMGVSCIGSGIDNNTNVVNYNGSQLAGTPIVMDTTISHGGAQIIPGLSKTNIEGIGIRFYIKAITDSIDESMNNGLERQLVSFSYTTEGSIYKAPKNVEYITASVKAYTRGHFIKTASNRFLLNSEAKFAVRAELVKTGTVSNYGALSLKTPNTTYSTTAILSPTLPTNLFNGDAITIQQPACRLRGATNYQINLGRWVNMASNSIQSNVSLPVSGNTKSVGLNLECSGKLNNVEFSFQDTGASPLTNRNISLYDSIGGQKIEGLEVEMLYNGTRLNVHKMGEATTTYKTNTGAHGSIKTNPSDLTYNSQSSASFGARFVQRSAIKRNGVAYTGPVTGKVNMFVTYY
ncbi:hypothetical protein I2492_06610 [Budviciaceae bacterium CWB-B4]|uniref:Fimbrial protein n=1 Tax=Limnobaculum xujianqingii TaxID=2738837 RepID=A0A9D7AHG0_9GAMM|nr:hypothetical protein [Limnobaculum xujianqingii]MBK5072683.1 hypothetical protein [Limnobaculum xujianqingii]MBK5175992.1 hypothetical protein [Limnobaculum xujianqingii]